MQLPTFTEDLFVHSTERSSFFLLLMDNTGIDLRLSLL